MGKIYFFLKKRIRNILKPILKNPKNQKIVEKNILKKKPKNSKLTDNNQIKKKSKNSKINRTTKTVKK